jgi:hypothetical protein
VVSVATATSYGPLQTRSQNPLYLQLLALPMEAPHTLQRREVETTLHTTFSNVFEHNITGNTLLNLDMELWRTALVFGYGLGRRIDIKIELPFVTNGGGFLDGFVQDFHDTFGFPDGGRELVDENQFRYTLIQNSVELFNHDTQFFGLADLVVRIKIFILETRQLPVHVALIPYVKFPIGRQSQGLSSGRFDAGLALLAQKSWGDFSVTSHVGGVILGGHKSIDNLLRRGFVSFGQSIEYRIVSHLALIVQLTGNTSAFQNVEGTPLSDIVLDLNIGAAGAWVLRRDSKTQFFYQVSFTEDVLSKGPSVDFSVFFLVGVRY